VKKRALIYLNYLTTMSSLMAEYRWEPIRQDFMCKSTWLQTQRLWTEWL